MELVASLFCLEYIVGLIGIDRSERPAVLPTEPPQLASIIFWGLIAEASDIVTSPRVDGDATEIINGVGVAEDNISVGIGVLRPAVHSVAVAVDEGEVATLVNAAD